MTGDGDPARHRRLLAWITFGLVIFLLALGAVWHGLTAEVAQRIGRDVIDRAGGPMWFRFLLQPAMGVLAAFYDGMADARAGRVSFVWDLVRQRAGRGDKIHGALLATSRLTLIALAMDLVYQWRVLDTFYPGEAALTALLLAVAPYLLLRGTIARIASMTGAAAATSSKGPALAHAEATAQAGGEASERASAQTGARAQD